MTPSEQKPPSGRAATTHLSPLERRDTRQRPGRAVRTAATRRHQAFGGGRSTLAPSDGRRAESPSRLCWSSGPSSCPGPQPRSRSGGCTAREKRQRSRDFRVRVGGLGRDSVAAAHLQTLVRAALRLLLLLLRAAVATARRVSAVGRRAADPGLALSRGARLRKRRRNAPASLLSASAREPCRRARASRALRGTMRQRVASTSELLMASAALRPPAARGDPAARRRSRTARATHPFPWLRERGVGRAARPSRRRLEDTSAGGPTPVSSCASAQRLGSSLRRRFAL